MSILRKLAGETAIYGVGSVMGRVLNYLLVPLYTTKGVFTIAEFGIVTELYAYVAFLNILYIYGLETAYFRFTGKLKGDIYSLAFTSILFSSILLSGFAIFFSSEIAGMIGYPDKSTFISWLGLIMAIDAVVAIPFARLRKEGKAKHFAMYKLSNIVLNLGLNLFFLLLCPMLLNQDPNHWITAIYSPDIGVGYVFLSNLIANGLFLIFFIPTWLKTRLSFNFIEWKKLMVYAWPILIIGFAGVTNEMLSRAILKYRLPEGFYNGLTNIEVLGIFGACYKLSIFMMLAVQAFRYAFEPFFFSRSSDKSSPKLFSNVMSWFVIFVSLSWLSISVLLPYIAPIFLRQPEYLKALDAVPWLLGGGLFLGVFYNLSIWYKLTDKTTYGALISLIGAASTFLLNWFLIPIYGYMGSAFATFFSYFMMTLISFLWGKKHYPVPYNLVKVLGYIGLGGFGIILNNWLGESAFSAVMIILFFLTLLFLFERKNLKRLKVADQ